MVEGSDNIFLSKSNNAMQYLRIARVLEGGQHQAFAMTQVASCFLLILHIGTTKEKVSHYQDSKSIGGGEYQQCPPRKLVEVKIKPVFTMTSCELPSWESPNCGCTAVAKHPYNANISTFILFCSKCQGIRSNLF